MSAGSELRASVDIGTNSVRLLVVDLGGASVRLVHDEGVLTRLGDSLATSGRIEGPPLEATLAAIERYATTARDLGAELTCFATASLRDAANAADVLPRLRAAAGTAVATVSGQQEAILSLIGARAGMSPLPERLVVVDIGGGSTEIAWGSEGLEGAVSLPLGSRKLRDRVAAFRANLPVSSQAFAEGRAVAGSALADAAKPGAAYSGALLAGIGGTITTLAALHLGLAEYEPMRVHGTSLSTDALASLADRLCAMPLAARSESLLEPERADLIVPGLALLLAALSWLGTGSVTANVFGVRLGVLTDEGARVLASRIEP